MSETGIRPATAFDGARIAAIHIQAWQQGYAHLLPEHYLRGLGNQLPTRTRQWQERIREGQRVLLAERAGQVIGWLVWGHSRDAEARAGCGEIHAINLDPAHWRLGAGRRLMETAHAELAGAGFSEVTLWVLEGNARALAFYQTLGYQRDQGLVHEQERGGATLREWRLRRPLA